MLNKIEKKAIDELIEKLKETYGDNLFKVILYGSKARGDQTEDSDIDIMVVLRNYNSWDEEFDRISEIVYEIEAKYNYEVLISFIIKRKDEFNISNMPLILNVKNEGISLWMRE
jgi:predicted nucleotidyltransferase